MIMPPLVLVCVHPTVAAPIASAPPSNRVVMAEVIGNPEPVIDREMAGPADIAPLVTESEIDERVFVNVDDAVLKKLSVAEIVCSATGKVGTMKLATMKDPVNALDVTVTETLSMVIDSTAFAALFATPETTTVVVVPTAAGFGDTTVIVGAPVLVKVAAPAIPVVVTECTPAPDEGTVNIPYVVGTAGHAFAAH